METGTPSTRIFTYSSVNPFICSGSEFPTDFPMKLKPGTAFSTSSSVCAPDCPIISAVTRWTFSVVFEMSSSIFDALTIITSSLPSVSSEKSGRNEAESAKSAILFLIMSQPLGKDYKFAL